MNDISVILTVYKRNYIDEQLRRIYAQTVDISNVYVYQNESHIDISHLKEKYDFKQLKRCHRVFCQFLNNVFLPKPIC